MTLAQQFVQHLFITSNGTKLDSWDAAFTSVVCIPSSDKNNADLQPEMVWLRLTGDGTVAQQVAAVRLQFASQPLIVMSDIPNDMEALAVFSVAARGYCNSHSGVEVLRNIAGVVAQGGLWIGESIMQRLLKAPAQETLPTVASNNLWAINLTEREREIAKIVTLGLSNEEIATELGITVRTVKAHIGAILEKLQLKNRLQLALFVLNS